jgi:hypothetical protein
MIRVQKEYCLLNNRLILFTVKTTPPPPPKKKEYSTTIYKTPTEISMGKPFKNRFNQIHLHYSKEL